MAGRPIITLTTDFGLEDEYVGTLKGVLLSFLPNAQIIDITHAIAPQDIQGASYILARSCVYFPDSTVHLAVVDPGVGSTRPLLALKTSRHYFVGPDNGVFGAFLQSGPAQVHRIVNKNLFLSPVSHTFQGRDIMAPVAARIAGGMDIGNVGPAVSIENCCALNARSPEWKGNQLHGEIVCRDHFGNIRTNITEEDIRAFSGAGQHIILQIGAKKIARLHSTYADKEPGTLIALVDSSGFVEIAAVNSNAWEIIDARIGERVIVTRQVEE